MNRLTKATAVGALLLFGAAGCADLGVVNPNDPDRGGALANAADVESLVSGAFNSWYTAGHTNRLLPLSSMSFQHSAPWANFGMHKYSLFPRATLINSPTDSDYSLIEVPWTRSYRAIAAAAEGMRAINDPATGIADQLGPDRVVRANAFGNFVLGLAHANIAVLYDQGFVVDETTDLNVAQEAVPYDQVMAAAIGYFQTAIDLANANDFDIESSWIMTSDGEDLSSADFARLAHSYRAAYRASLPRTEEERSLVDWNAVLADVDAGMQEDWVMNQDQSTWYNSFLDYGTWESWQQIPYFLFGMGDTSGNYQTWLNTPLADRQPIIDGQDILIVTPDERFPQGSTLAEQEANPGTKVIINPYRGSNWAQAARGTWRWSYYHNNEHDPYNSWSTGLVEEIEREELDLLAAEAHYWLENYDAAADLINNTRVAAGLNATDASGTNTSCVPTLPDGTCTQDLLELLKWEKRMEVWHTGMVMSLPFYFDNRRWGDHYLGTALQFPMPGGELQTLQMPSYTFGGAGGESASTGSNYNFPSEG